MKLSLPGMASGWNVDRQNHNYEHHDRIKHDFRDVETPTPPLLYSLLVHGRKQHRGYVLQEWHDVSTNQTGPS